VLLEALAELAVVIDEHLRIGRKLEAQARADERGVAAEASRLAETLKMRVDVIRAQRRPTSPFQVPFQWR
jgi:hypothetical protein